MAIQERSKLRGLILGRTRTEAADGSLRLRVDFSAPLTSELRAALTAELQRHRAAPIDGLVAPRDIEIGGQYAELTLDAIHPGALRLSDLLAGLRASQTPLEDGLAAALTATAAQLTHKIHLAPGLHGRPRLHGALHPGALVLTPLGTVALIGTGLPYLDALLLPPDPAAEARHTAPEVAAGSAVDPRSDIYGLGVLYLSLLSGQIPWPDATPEGHLAELAAGRLSNPQVSIPNPRASLVDLLRRAMAPSITNRFPSALGFGQAISNELKASGRPRSDAAALERLISGAVPSDAPRGPAILARDPGAPGLSPRAASSTGGGWSQVLGEPSAVQPRPAAPTPKTPSAPASTPPGPAIGRISLPVPAEAEPPASTGGLRLPPSGPNPAPSGPTAPALPASSPIDALYDEDVPSAASGPASRRTPRVSTADEGSLKGTLLLGAALLAGVFGVWFVAGGDDPADLGDSTPDAAPGAVVAPPSPTAPSGIGVSDAGSALSNVPLPMPKAPPLNARDAGVALKPLGGFLMVFSTPTGATVELDGGYVGKTPLVLKHDFDVNRAYELTLLRDGYKRWTKRVTPDREKRSINVKAILEMR